MHAKAINKSNNRMSGVSWHGQQLCEGVALTPQLMRHLVASDFLYEAEHWTTCAIQSFSTAEVTDVASHEIQL